MLPQWFRNISIAHKLYFMVGVMALLIAIELFALVFSINALSSVRAYVGAEGLWSKAQKNAIYNLRKYTSSGKEEDYQEFLRFLEVPLGDRQTRIEMGKENPNYEIMRKGFLQGEVHPDDIDGMIKLFRRFHNISYINKAIKIWTQGDSLLADLEKSADKLHTLVLVYGGLQSDKRIEAKLSEIDKYNIELTVLENAFSNALGEGARWLENLILKILLSIALTVEFAGILLGISLSLAISKGIKEVIRVATKIIDGDFSERAVIFSKDEIGDLSISFNKMIDELAISNERFLKIFESNPIGMSLSEIKSGKITYANHIFYASFGYTKEEVIGKTSEELNLISAEEKANGLEVLFTRKNGETFFAIVSYGIIEISNEKYTITSYQDISERKKAEVQLNQSKIELEGKNKDLEQFAYIASHDLQEPLRTISNYVGLFEKQYKGKLDNNSDEYLNFISSATRRMQTLIHDLLEYSKIGRDKTTIEIDCNQLLMEVLNDMAVPINESNANIKSAKLPTIKGYAILKSLFQNLISNAIKFRKKETPAIVNITVQSQNKNWLFAIKDNGIGIDKTHHDKIFKVFMRLHSSEEYPGTGIGLAQCKKIIELHQGKIWVESEPEKGSTFYFTIPKVLSKETIGVSI